MGFWGTPSTTDHVRSVLATGAGVEQGRPAARQRWGGRITASPTRDVECHRTGKVFVPEHIESKSRLLAPIDQADGKLAWLEDLKSSKVKSSGIYEPQGVTIASLQE